MKDLTNKERWVLEFIRMRPFGEWIGPTKIGILAFGYDYRSASSRVNAPIKKLLALGYIERSPKGEYRLVKP